MNSTRKPDTLATYEHYMPDSAAAVERMFHVTLVLCVGLFMGLGIYLKQIKQPVKSMDEEIGAIRAKFVITQPPKPVAVKKAPAVVKKSPVQEARPVEPTSQEPIDLTKNPVLAQKTDDIQKSSGGPVVRRVYGLRKVYARGIGAGGNMADAVVGKLGNTLNKDFDTLTATKIEAKGEIVSVTTVTSMPKMLKQVKPEMTEEMIKNKIEGVIKLRLLIDIDGKVKKAEALNDLGFGSAERAVAACYEMLFEPAMRGEEPVATIITISIRFVQLG
jgi:hypothetical protein